MPIKAYCAKCNTVIEANAGDGKKYCVCREIYIKIPKNPEKYIQTGAKNGLGSIYRVHGYDKR